MTQSADRTDTDRLAAFWRNVKRMRALQCGYFKHRNTETLTASKEAEKIVDRWVDALGVRFGELGETGEK